MLQALNIKVGDDNNWAAKLIFLLCFNLFLQFVVCFAYYSANQTFATLIDYTSHFSSLTSSFWRPLLPYLAVEIAINILFMLWLWYLIASVARLFDLSKQVTNRLVIPVWLVSTVFILTANYYYYPNTMFAGHLVSNLNLAYVKIVYLLTAAIMLTLTMLAIVNSCLELSRRKHLWTNGLVLIFLAWIGYVCESYYIAEVPSTATINAGKPDVIMIGLDAIRPDHTGYYGHGHTPTIDKFLSSAINFSDNTTPLARTFPSWASILTGKYPKHSNARQNFGDLNRIALNETLAKSFQENGYETIFATDDDTFSPITEKFGFDHVVGSPNGLGTFLIGMFNDLPLSNILINTPFGKIFFPYNFGNHTISLTYYPESFLHNLKVSLAHRNGKPLFFAVHFNISGWPQGWARTKMAANDGPANVYAETITEVDRQLNSFLQILADNHLLDNALVILLSDHGTAVGLQGDRVTKESLYQGDKNNIRLTRVTYNDPLKDSNGNLIKNGIDTTQGYGNEVLSDTAYHTLLSFKSYGFTLATPRNIPGPSSMLDIAPTILDLLNLPPLKQGDGFSLKPYITDAHYRINPERPLLRETTLSMPEVEAHTVSMQKVIRKAENLFEIDPKIGTITIKLEAEKGARKNAEKAIVQGDWLLADLPNSLRYRPDGHNGFQPYVSPPQLILVNLKTGLWTSEMNSTFAQQAPLALLEQQLKSFYGDELSALNQLAT